MKSEPYSFVVPCEAAFETTPTIVEIPVTGCPDDLGAQKELMYVGFMSVVKPADAGNNIKGDLEWVDDSNGDGVTNLITAFDFTGTTARVMNTIFNSRQILDPGDTVNMEMDTTTPDTAANGAGLLVVERFTQFMAD